jgi:hypothetical protein
MARASLLFNLLRLEPSHGSSLIFILSVEARALVILVINFGVEALALVMAHASLLFNLLGLEGLSRPGQ